MEAVGGLLALVSLAGLGCSLVAMVRPLPRIGLTTRRRGVYAFVISFLGVLVAGTLLPDVSTTETTAASQIQHTVIDDTVDESPGKTQAANLTTQARQLAIAGISGYPEILDAAITQQGDSLSLVLIVPPGTPEARARELGDNFVRMTKTFAGDGAPGREIGQGKFDYTIGVYTPTERQIALGAKVGPARRVTW